MAIRKGRRVLLLGPRNYLVDAAGTIETKFGKLELNKLAGKKWGTKLKAGKNEFTAVQPTLLDFFSRKARRGPAVVLPKDAAAIAAHTGAGRGWKVVDAGSGSGWLALFLANIGCNVTSYEIRKDFHELAKQNVRDSGLKVKLKNRDVTKGIAERDVDLVTLDMKNPEKAIVHAHRALRPGGWLAVFSMHTEEVAQVVKAAGKGGWTSPRTIELLERGWQVEIFGKTFTRPRTHMLAHTGFLTFARKL
jgi:tRNA (adenine57-N1/adenine58-N1)-methyltransferase